MWTWQLQTITSTRIVFFAKSPEQFKDPWIFYHSKISRTKIKKKDNFLYFLIG